VPELPEVETISRQLRPVLVGRRLERVRVLDERLTRPEPPEAVAHELEGERIAAVDRRGKYVVVGFESGSHLLVHLRMTGSFRAGDDGFLEDDPYRRAVVRLDDGSDVAYRDVRRFGTWRLLGPGELDAYLATRLGPEPFDRRFTSEALAGVLEERRAAVKTVLLDQRRIAGVGNIYADEALWLARVDPRCPAATLEPGEIRALHRGLRRVLRAGIERQGASLRDYRDTSGVEGTMQDEFRVYGRTGLPCARCRTPIAKTRVAGRGTWYCPRCQPPRAR
jgi:formamidopyrimidine-DNA glycosylase